MTQNAHGIQIGDLFYESWGYEQTNIDYYEVVGLKGKATAIIRPVKRDYVGGYGWSGKCRPVPGEYTGPAHTVRTRLCDYYRPARPQVSSPTRTGHRLNPTSADEIHYYSSYA